MPRWPTGWNGIRGPSPTSSPCPSGIAIARVSCSAELKENPYNHQTRQLEGVPFRRVVFGFRGDKRMIYTVDDHMKLVAIYAVGDRRTIYERLPGIAP